MLRNRSAPGVQPAGAGVQSPRACAGQRPPPASPAPASPAPAAVCWLLFDLHRLAAWPW